MNYFLIVFGIMAHLNPQSSEMSNDHSSSKFVKVSAEIDPNCIP